MVSINEASANEMMNEDPDVALTSSSLAQVKDKMEEKLLRAIPVVDDEDELQGAIGYRDLIRFIQFNPERTKLSKVMHQPPEFDMNDSLVDLVDLRINSGRKMLVSTTGAGKLKGVIRDEEFRAAMSDVEELENINTRDIATVDLHTAFEDDSLEKTRHAMLDHNISRLPVLDENGNLTGIVHSTDMLKTMIPREAQDAGGVAGQRDGSEVHMAGGNEKNQMSDIPTEEIMQRTLVTSEEHMKASKAIEKMVDQDSYEIVFVDGKYPESIVTLKDFIEHVAGYAPGKTVLVNLVGLNVPEEKAAVHEKIRKQLQGSLGRKLERPEEFKINIKKADKDGKKHRYELNFQLVSEHGVTNVDVEEWDLLNAVDEGLEELNTIIGREKNKRQDHR